MERPQAFANLWIILQVLGFIVALEPVAQYFSDRHYQHVYRRLFLLYFHSFRGLEHDPARPRPPESWEEWYNS
jgi:hypothetical protein